MIFGQEAGLSSKPGSAVVRAKATVKQNDFSRGAMRAEYLESDNDPVRQRSLQAGVNLRPVARRGLRRRWGTFLESTISGTAFVDGIVSIEPVTGMKYNLVLVSGGLRIYDEDGDLDTTFSSLPWTAMPWVAPAGRDTFIGGEHAIYRLRYNAGGWALGVMAFADLPSGALAQPYYNFERGVRITPSARTGAITVTASKSIFTADYVGLRLRYHDKEIEITGYTSATVVSGTVLEKLPPSFDLVVNNAEGFEKGEVVTGATSDWSGYISSVNTGTNTVKAVSLSGYEGPDATEMLVGPNTKSKITSKTYVGPYASTYWVEPVISAVRGYPKSGAIVNGRLILCNFDEVPDLVSASSVRAPNDFEPGLEDDDAILRKVGDAGVTVRHAINAGDLIFLTDSGALYINARDNQEITPNNFAPTKFDSRAATDTRPVFVDNAVLYTSGEDVLVAVLTGNVYLNWSVVVASDGYDGLYGQIVGFAEPSANLTNEERAVLMPTEDGTIVALFFNAGFDDFGLFEWTFESTSVTLRGSDTCLVLGASAMGGSYWLLTEREMEAGGATTYHLERMDVTALLDLVTVIDNSSPVTIPAVYDGATLTVMDGEKYIGTYETIADAEAAIDAYATSTSLHIGLAWEPQFQPWPVELIESQRLGMLRARTIRIAVSVRNTASFYVLRNGIKSEVEGYSFGDDLSEAPPQKTGVYRFAVLGNRDHPEITVGQDLPGPFEVLAYTSEVQG